MLLRTLFTCLLFIASTHMAFSLVRYVTASGAGSKDGSSWANAAPGTSLQEVINFSEEGDQVWVACGLYKTTTTPDRNISFIMKNGVSIYGSFSGNEANLAQRIFSCGPCSILSGEIGALGNFDNSFHVVSNPVGLTNSAIIDGFVIQDANDDRAPTISNGLGGGIYNDGGNTGNFCNPTIKNCIIQNNRAQYGAGVFNSGHSGGNASPVLTNCVITNNSAYIGGGGIDNFGLAGNANPLLTNCIVYKNTAIERAGGMYCWGGNNGNANPVAVNSVFVNNSAGSGGGLVSDIENSPGGSFSGTSSPTFRNSIIYGNTATGMGSQFYIIGGALVNATYSAVDISQQTSPNTLSGQTTGNITTNPLLVNSINGIGTDNCWFTSDDGLRLQSGSPLINSGSMSDAPSFDISGAIRTGNPDIGAYEFVQTVTALVKKEAPGYDVYPNPVLDDLHISFTDTIIHQIELYDVTGRLIQLKAFSLGDTFSLQHMAPGTYIMRIDGSAQRKIVKK